MFKDFMKAPVEITVLTEEIIAEADDAIGDTLKTLKDSNIKVKTIIPTRFGTEVVFYNKAAAQDAANLVKADVDVDSNSIFVTNKG